MKELDRELKDAYDAGYRVGYLSLPPIHGYSILSDPCKEWQRGRAEGEKARATRIESEAAARKPSSPST